LQPRHEQQLVAEDPQKTQGGGAQQAASEIGRPAEEDQGAEEQEAGGAACAGDRQGGDLRQGALGDRVVRPPEQDAEDGRRVPGTGIGRLAAAQRAWPPAAGDGAAGRCRTPGSAFSMSKCGSFFASWQVAHTPWMMQKEHWSVMP